MQRADKAGGDSQSGGGLPHQLPTPASALKGFHTLQQLVEPDQKTLENKPV